jgi:hypothetical protein
LGRKGRQLFVIWMFYKPSDSDTKLKKTKKKKLFPEIEKFG